MSPQTIIFIGRSGCGKGTQADLFKAYLEREDHNKRPVYYLETGAQFREFINGGTYTSKLSKEIYERSELQPAFLAVKIWSQLFDEKLTGEEHLIIDGTPRSQAEAMVLESALGFYGRRSNVVYLNVSREVSRKHLLERGRGDDVSVQIERRLNWFEGSVEPAIEYLKKIPNANFVEINGEQPIEAVHEEVKSKIKIF